MNMLQSKTINCPYCAETIELLVDCSIEEQEYIEDCEVCCRPICLQTHIDFEGILFVVAKTETE